MEPLDIEDLKEKAGKAKSPEGLGDGWHPEHALRGTNFHPVDASFIAACSPDVILSMISDLSRLRSENEGMRKALELARDCLDGEPDYHHQGMGCGLEDRNITDRYEAMEHGWDCAMERVYSEHIIGAREAIAAVLS